MWSLEIPLFILLLTFCLATGLGAHVSLNENKDGQVLLPRRLLQELHQDQTYNEYVMFFKIDPSSDPRRCPDCAKLDPFWGMAAEFYTPRACVLRGSCDGDEVEFCMMHGIENWTHPLILVWTTTGPKGTAFTLRQYEGKSNLECLKEWMDEMLFNSESAAKNNNTNILPVGTLPIILPRNENAYKQY